MSNICVGCNGHLYGCPYEDSDATFCNDKEMINAMTNLAYQQGRADADAFLKQWKDDVMESLGKYDANSVEEVYQYGINKGRADAIEEMKKLILPLYCSCCNQIACDGGQVGSIQECASVSLLRDVVFDLADELKENKK